MRVEMFIRRTSSISQHTLAFSEIIWKYGNVIISSHNGYTTFPKTLNC